MNQGTQGYSLTKKPEGRKSRETIPLSSLIIYIYIYIYRTVHVIITV
jgi:hypothetical protein